MLAADERLVIPAGKVVKFLITSEDVIHSFAVPAFWTKMDANPGRINQDWVKVDRPGVYFGQCSELCGARHGFMPIAVEVLPQAQFDAWLASKGGTPKGAKAPAPASQGKVEIAPAPAAALGASAPAAIEQPVVNQPATAGAIAGVTGLAPRGVPPLLASHWLNFASGTTSTPIGI